MSSRIITPGRFKRLDLLRWSRMHYVETGLGLLDISVWSRRTETRLFQASVLDKLRFSALIRPNISALLEFASKQIFCLLFMNDAPEIIFSNIQIFGVKQNYYFVQTHLQQYEATFLTFFIFKPLQSLKFDNFPKKNNFFLNRLNYLFQFLIIIL